jgi:uncharacterized protein (DUF433 family)
VDTIVLDRQLYDEALAARVLRMSRSTLHWWLEGGVRRGKWYDPVLRSVPTGSREVTWGELVEARYLREYRQKHLVQLWRLRAFIAHLRDGLGVPYPLAHARPWVGADRRLFVVAQELASLPPELWACVEPTRGVMLLTHPAELFLERVEFDDKDGLAVRLWPQGKGSPVVIDPEVRFGEPSVRGIPTESLAEQVRAGDVIEAVADDFGLDLDDLIAALGYEGIKHPRAA